MKREGRQRGLVRTQPVYPFLWNPRPESRILNRLDSPPTAGLFTKVSPKPTNHSKFTGKCGRPRCAGCHLHPATKSKDKAKGTQKLRSSDSVSLLTWRLVNNQLSPAGSNFSGVSATGLLDHLVCFTDDDDSDDRVDPENDNEVLQEPSADETGGPNLRSRTVLSETKEDIDDDDEGKIDFCDVSVAWEEVDGDEEDWCLVQEEES